MWRFAQLTNQNPHNQEHRHQATLRNGEAPSIFHQNNKQLTTQFVFPSSNPPERERGTVINSRQQLHKCNTVHLLHAQKRTLQLFLVVSEDQTLSNTFPQLRTIEMIPESIVLIAQRAAQVGGRSCHPSYLGWESVYRAKGNKRPLHFCIGKPFPQPHRKPFLSIALAKDDKNACTL